MCLIAYMPAGHKMPEENLVAAHKGNSDGIGIMHEGTGAWFVGRKALKKARRYLRNVVEPTSVAHGIHFRYATHGAVTLHNCHPFRLPNAAGFLMHNGVLGQWASKATKHDSDTYLFVQSLIDIPPQDDTVALEAYWKKIGAEIGGNKLLVMTPTGRFITVNEYLGDWIDGIWYSQTYSLPWGVARSAMYGGGYARTYTGDTTSWWDKHKRTQDDTDAYQATLRAAYERRYGPVDDKPVPTHRALVPISAPYAAGGYTDQDYDDETVNDPWRAWYRDKYGNDPKADITEQAALDSELKANMLDGAEDDPAFCGLCGQSGISLDADGMCQHCAWELIQNPELYDDPTIMRGWSEQPNVNRASSEVDEERIAAVKAGMLW